MKIGICGMGKIGLPFALVAASKGHDVVGYDINPKVAEYLAKKEYPFVEEGVYELLMKTRVRMVSLPELVDFADIIFVPVQTPHDERYEGRTRLPAERMDFEYRYLKEAIMNINNMRIVRAKKNLLVSVISTVLPGTMRRHIVSQVTPNADNMRVAYNPFFPAMGTVIPDLLGAEFNLIGVDDPKDAEPLVEFYKTINSAPCRVMSIESAELTKVAYNTFISSRIAIANTLMEICHKMPGCNIDDVMGTLKLATKRVVSTSYMDGGMGDGGGCHPRDGIAMSHLARELGLSYDWFENAMLAREKQAEFLCKLVAEKARETGLPICILGTAFKPGTNIETGSAALLCKSILEEWGHKVTTWDPYISKTSCHEYWLRQVYLIGCKHHEFARGQMSSGESVHPIFYPGSVVIDPFRYIPDQEGVEVVHVGVGKKVK